MQQGKQVTNLIHFPAMTTEESILTTSKYDTSFCFLSWGEGKNHVNSQGPCFDLMRPWCRYGSLSSITVLLYKLHYTILSLLHSEAWCTLYFAPHDGIRWKTLELCCHWGLRRPNHCTSTTWSTSPDSGVLSQFFCVRCLLSAATSTIICPITSNLL